MVGKPFYMMFNCLDGGVIEPIELSKDQFTDDRSIILLDEENRTVWLWHGKIRTLIQRRVALRQAESLKGHGYRAGNAIIGRDLRQINEIDSRKIDRVPEDTELNKKLMEILDKKFSEVGNYIYVEGSADADSVGTIGLPKKGKESTSEGEEKKKLSSINETKAELSHTSVEESTVKPSEVKANKEDLEKLMSGAVIIAVMEHYKDIWLSLKDDGSITVEQMDGKICTFKITNGKVEYLAGSFAEVPSDIRAKIEERAEELIKALE